MVIILLLLTWCIITIFTLAFINIWELSLPVLYIVITNLTLIIKSLFHSFSPHPKIWSYPNLSNPSFVHPPFPPQSYALTLQFPSIHPIPFHTPLLNLPQVATASEKGTVIRVFNVSDGARLHELRRGMKRCATIFSLAFSPDALFLIASSNTETVHVFKLEEVKDTWV